MTDGALATMWQTGRPQRRGDEMVVEFDRAVTLSAVELDLGAAKDDYPRKLRITAADDAGATNLVWQNSLAGLALLAEVNDRDRRALRIDLPPSAPLKKLVLTLLEGHPQSWWSIAELKVVGHE